jgi:hypothetical protein
MSRNQGLQSVPRSTRAELTGPGSWKRPATKKSGRAGGGRMYKGVVPGSQNGNPGQYIPDAARATIYRKAAKSLAKAKDSSYGWAAEVTAAKSLAQLGPYVPSVAIEEVY